MSAPLIPPDLLEMMERGVSVNVGSRDAQLRPSLMRGLGSLIEDGGRRITVYLARRQSRQLVLDIAATGHVAAVFSEPHSHKAVQVKASKAQLRNATDADRPVLARYLAAMEVAIGRVGFPAELVRAMYTYELEDVVAVTFEPEQAFDQTPGPKAGARVGKAS
jgi:hypothetical protein